MQLMLSVVTFVSLLEGFLSHESTGWDAGHILCRSLVCVSSCTYRQRNSHLRAEDTFSVCSISYLYWYRHSTTNEPVPALHLSSLSYTWSLLDLASHFLRTRIGAITEAPSRDHLNAFLVENYHH